ncbi:MAG TPA: 5-formyltetrahydrofolate cyclo-ligase [Steroidobacteraceae bacterium]|nr:5-formyltetrahydrofolate cyclo-ligase [Steroidobacteraceae bacterium]
MQTKPTLRIEMLTRRRAVPRAARVAAARAIARIVAQTHWLRPGKRIGIYASMPRELGTALLIQLALARGCHVYVPRITSLRGRTMRFVKYTQASNRRGSIHALGMYEPCGHEYLSARFLDTVFVPGVCFDRRGARLGHGLGFYDRMLSFRQLRQHWRGPRLVGLAYSLQVVPQVPVTATDVFMDTIVTERGIDELLADENRAIHVRSR